MESVGLLAGGVAHDFNNLLTVIQGHASLLLSHPALDVEAQESAEQISLAAERAATLTRQLLTFSRKQVMQARRLDLNDVVVGVASMLTRVLGEDIQLQVNYGSKSPFIYADAGMMEQVLMNLSVNARDAMAKGGQIVISVTDEFIGEDFVRRSPKAMPGQYVCLSVQDDGCGIPSEILPRIFDPFFTTKEVGKGTGLGLATVYGIVHQHHGWIDLSTEVGRGTTFRVYLPATAHAESQLSGAEESEVRGGKETILLVEDDAAVRVLVRNVLERYGYTIVEAVSGPSGLRAWQAHRRAVALVITDMVMPGGMTGRELGQQLLARKPDLPIIYTSGYSAEVVGKDFDLRDGRNFLQKPYAPRLLAQTVRRAMDAAKA